MSSHHKGDKNIPNMGQHLPGYFKVKNRHTLPLLSGLGLEKVQGAL